MYELRTNHARTIHHANDETCEVIVIGVHHSGMLGHLATHECAACLATSAGDAFNDTGDRLGLELTHSDVVEKKERLGSCDHHVVNAHGHEVLTHRVVLIKQLCDGELGAHTVCAAH